MANSAHSPETLGRLLAGGPTGDEQSALLWAMSVEERAAAMRRGALSLGQLTELSSAYPQEVALIAGDFEYIARFEPGYLGAAGMTVGRARRDPASFPGAFAVEESEIPDGMTVAAYRAQRRRRTSRRTRLGLRRRRRERSS